MSEPTDLELVEAARQGDTAAIEQLLLRQQPRVYRFGMTLCRDPEDARDVLQDTLFAMARSIRDFRGASSVSTWLFAIARSFCVKKRRRSKFAPEALQSLDALPEAERRRLTDPSPAPDLRLTARELAAALDGAVASLEPKYREVFLLREIEGLAAAEVAEVLGLSVEAVKSRLHRARAAVRDQVVPLLGLRKEPPPTGCPDIAAVMSRHLEGELSPAQCGEMEKHLEGCGRCRGDCEALKRTLALCREAPAPVLPEEVRRSVQVALRRFLEQAS
jgi:RNA polymerase sigma-70 factor (ECF subfamily)